MRPLGTLIGFDEALKIALASVRPVPWGARERVGLSEAAGRVLAEPVESPIDIPGTARAAMDGYAVRAADVASAGRERPRSVDLRIEGAVAAGAPAGSRLGPPGAAIEIATGAVMPEGADAVVPVEKTQAGPGRVRVMTGVAAGANVIERASDVARGATILSAGEVLTAGRIGAAAAVGLTEVWVLRKPGVFILSTGDEVREPDRGGGGGGEGGGEVAPHQVYNSNGPALAVLVRAAGAQVSGTASVADDRAAIRDAVERTGFPDFLLFTGGSSVGNRDYALDVVRDLGTGLLFHGVRVKPGKPVLCARAGPDARTGIFGMPGYPASCLLVGAALVAPALRRAARLPERPGGIRARLAEPVLSAAGRTDLVPVKLAGDRARSCFKGSYAVTSVSAADGFIVIPEGVERLEAGEEVEVRLF